MTQPTFVPVPVTGAVRPTLATPPAAVGRPAKAGLQRTPHPPSGTGAGTPAPDAGYALTIAHHELAAIPFDHEHDRDDVVLGVALVAAKRASVVGRGPTRTDVRVAMEVLGISSAERVTHHLAEPFAGLAHSYFRQREFVDAVTPERLLAPATQR